MLNIFLRIARQINGKDFAVILIGKTYYNVQQLNGKTIITKNIRGF